MFRLYFVSFSGLISKLIGKLGFTNNVLQQGGELVKKMTAVLFLVFLSEMTWGQIIYTQENTQWPIHCAPLADIKELYYVSRYMRFYPTARMAKDNSVEPGHLISGFSPISEVVVFSQNEFPELPSVV